MNTTNTYEQKKASRIERMEARIARLRSFAEGKDLSLFSESRSGIPLGQPILVGHHSERRHRRHLERLNKLVQAGFDAHAKADKLEARLESIRRSNIIQVDNPDAAELIKAKIAKLEKSSEAMKAINKMIRSLSKFDGDKVTRLAEMIEASPYKPTKRPSLAWAAELMKPSCFGTLGFESFELSNTSAEIRRLKGRLVELERINEGFEPFEINGISVELVDGQIQVDFPGKPSDETRSKLKRSPLALKWSSYSKRWVRKHTASTSGRYFTNELKAVLEAATY